MSYATIGDKHDLSECGGVGQRLCNEHRSVS